MTMDIVQEILSDLMQGVEELLWPQESLDDFVLPTSEEEKPFEKNRHKDVESSIIKQKDVEVISIKQKDDEVISIKQKDVEMSIKKEEELDLGSSVADVCLQKYWFRISQGRQHLAVLGIYMTNTADIKEKNLGKTL